MERKEAKFMQEVISYISLISAGAVFVLSMLSIFDVVELRDDICHAVFSVIWLCNGFTHKNRKLSIFYYVISGIHLFTALLYVLM